MELSLKEQIIYYQLLEFNYQELVNFVMDYQSQVGFDNRITFAESYRIMREHIVPQSKGSKNYALVTSHQWSNYQKWVHYLLPRSVMLHEPAYPTSWYHIYRPPVIVYYLGDGFRLGNKPISIVGTRKITPYGQQMVDLIVQQLADKGYTTVSGLALGVDAAVHRASLNYQAKTVAILPCGFHTIYPKQHNALYQKIEQHGCLISEYLPWQPPKKHHFILRNRLVAGLSPATLVIEAAQRSGSLITANYALQYNREVMVLPGRVTDSQSAGCNELIAAGALPIISMTQLMEELALLYSTHQHNNI